MSWDLERAVDGRGDGRDGAGPGGGYDGRLCVFQQPPDRLAVGLVAEFSSQLENSGCAGGRHTNPASPAFYFGVSVLGGSSLDEGVLHGDVLYSTVVDRCFRLHADQLLGRRLLGRYG